jgi:hypothetical protein
LLLPLLSLIVSLGSTPRPGRKKATENLPRPASKNSFTASSVVWYENMATVMPLENLNVRTGTVITELDIDDPESAALPMDHIQAALTEDQMRDSIGNRELSTCRKWIHYIVSWVMLFSGFAVIIAGMTSTHENGWGLAFIA